MAGEQEQRLEGRQGRENRPIDNMNNAYGKQDEDGGPMDMCWDSIPFEAFTLG